MCLKSIKHNNERYTVIPPSGSWHCVGFTVIKRLNNTWIVFVVNSLGNRLSHVAYQAIGERTWVKINIISKWKCVCWLLWTIIFIHDSRCWGQYQVNVVLSNTSQPKSSKKYRNYEITFACLLSMKSEMFFIDRRLGLVLSQIQLHVSHCWSDSCCRQFIDHYDIVYTWLFSRLQWSCHFVHII